MLDQLEKVWDKMLKDVMSKGFELPITIVAISPDGRLFALRFTVNKSTGELHTRVIANFKEDENWNFLISCFFVDSQGNAEAMRIMEGSVLGISADKQNTH